MANDADKNIHQRWVDALRKAGVPNDKIADALGDVTMEEAAALNEIVKRF